MRKFVREDPTLYVILAALFAIETHVLAEIVRFGFAYFLLAENPRLKRDMPFLKETSVDETFYVLKS